MICGVRDGEKKSEGEKRREEGAVERWTVELVALCERRGEEVKCLDDRTNLKLSPGGEGLLRPTLDIGKKRRCFVFKEKSYGADNYCSDRLESVERLPDLINFHINTALSISGYYFRNFLQLEIQHSALYHATDIELPATIWLQDDLIQFDILRQEPRSFSNINIKMLSRLIQRRTHSEGPPEAKPSGQFSLTRSE
ncbi:hypothetical protein F2P81_014320 [Scophthalmus maximus]|uniref:Uncharacterized protein n=1 Tax=Scophthalmus maximus TaxID=52904 RepID=A0A6A4ST92_SCOMX|nr:hypothetical protein F2P81_014320 [Scophthalmus maximus]